MILHWWYAPLAAFVMFTVLAFWIGYLSRDYNPMTALAAGMTFITGVLVTVAIVLGHYV